jgi:hypothetical protein
MGFCDDSTNPFGASLELDVGAEIGLEAWKEINGDKDVLFEHVLFSDHEILELPDICLSFGDPPDGSCIPDMEEEEMAEWWDNEVDPGLEADEVDGFTKRAVLVSRAKRRSRTEDKKWKYYNMECDPRDRKADVHSKWPIWLKEYPGPTEIKNNNHAGIPVPIMNIGIKGCKNPTNINDCVPDNWVVMHETDPAKLNDVSNPNSMYRPWQRSQPLPY